MILNKEFQVNWEAIRNHCQAKAQVDKNNRENTSQKDHIYTGGNKCWIVNNKYECHCKLDKRADGSFEMLKVQKLSGQEEMILMLRNQYHIRTYVGIETGY